MSKAKAAKEKPKAPPNWCQQLDRAKAQVKNPRLPKQPAKVTEEPPK